MEILIVITIIVLLAVVGLVILNPWTQIAKGQDARRKTELTQLNKIFEDFYNDKNCYPKPDEVCYNSLSPTTCNICGNQSPIRDFSPYLSRLPCDPRQPTKKYLYQVDSVSCPTWYRIYADLSLSDYVNNDPSTEEVGCYGQSCGPAPNYGYDYGVSSPNIDLEKAVSFAYCATSGCNACGSYQDCLNKDISFFCQETRRIMSAAYCGIQNCPCQPQ